MSLLVRPRFASVARVGILVSISSLSLLLGCAPPTSRKNATLFTYETTSLAPKDCKIISVPGNKALRSRTFYRCPGLSGHSIVYSPRRIVYSPPHIVNSPRNNQHYLVYLRHFWIQSNSYRSKELVAANYRFHDIGARAEWRLRKGLFADKPEALIIPVSFGIDRHLETPSKIEEGYLVVKITPDAVCVTDFMQSKTLLSGVKLIEHARQAAVAARTKACLTPDY